MAITGGWLSFIDEGLTVLSWLKESQSEMPSLVLQYLFEYLLKNTQNSFGILEPERALDSAA